MLSYFAMALSLQSTYETKHNLTTLSTTCDTRRPLITNQKCSLAMVCAHLFMVQVSLSLLRDNENSMMAAVETSRSEPLLTLEAARMRRNSATVIYQTDESGEEIDKCDEKVLRVNCITMTCNSCMPRQ